MTPIVEQSLPINISIIFDRRSFERRSMNQASRRTFSIERNHASFVSRIDSLVFRKRVTTDSCWASETTSIWLVIPRVLVISHASVKYFSAVNGGIAMINKVLWQCYNVGVEITEISSVLNDAN